MDRLPDILSDDERGEHLQVFRNQLAHAEHAFHDQKSKREVSTLGSDALLKRFMYEHEHWDERFTQQCLVTAKNVYRTLENNVPQDKKIFTQAFFDGVLAQFIHAMKPASSSTSSTFSFPLVPYPGLSTKQHDEPLERYCPNLRDPGVVQTEMSITFADLIKTSDSFHHPASRVSQDKMQKLKSTLDVQTRNVRIKMMQLLFDQNNSTATMNTMALLRDVAETKEGAAKPAHTPILTESFLDGTFVEFATQLKRRWLRQLIANHAPSL